MRFGCFGTQKDVEAIARAGFDYAELNLRELISMAEDDFQNLLERMKAASLDADVISWILPSELDLTSESTNYADWKDYIETGIRRSLALGAKIWPIGSGWSRRFKPENGPEEAQKQRMLAFFADLADHVKPYGILVLIEPLGPNYTNHLTTLADCVSFVQALNRENVKTMCDLRHLTVSGVPLLEIETWQHLIYHAHIDIPVGDQRRFPRPGDGYDYTEYFRILQKIGAPRLSVESLHEDDMAEGRESIAYMKAILAGISPE